MVCGLRPASFSSTVAGITSVLKIESASHSAKDEELACSPQRCLYTPSELDLKFLEDTSSKKRSNFISPDFPCNTKSICSLVHLCSARNSLRQFCANCSEDS